MNSEPTPCAFWPKPEYGSSSTVLGILGAGFLTLFSGKTGEKSKNTKEITRIVQG